MHHLLPSASRHALHAYQQMLYMQLAHHQREYDLRPSPPLASCELRILVLNILPCSTLLAYNVGTSPLSGPSKTIATIRVCLACLGSDRRCWKSKRVSRVCAVLCCVVRDRWWIDCSSHIITAWIRHGGRSVCEIPSIRTWGDDRLSDRQASAGRRSMPYDDGRKNAKQLNERLDLWKDLRNSEGGNCLSIGASLASVVLR